MRTLQAGFVDRGDVRLGNIIFNAYDRNGVAWVLTDLDGWWDLPEVSLPDDPRPFEMDGSYYTPGRYMPRVISLQGVLVPPASMQYGAPAGFPARDLAGYARQVLGAGSNIVRNAAILQVDEETPKQAIVQLAAKPSFKNSRVNGVIEFQIQLKAGDPRKYSQLETQLLGAGVSRSTSGRHYPRVYPLKYITSDGAPPVTGGAPVTTASGNGTVVAENVGTYNTGAVIRLYGPISTPYIENIEQGKHMRFHLDIAEGDYLEINLLERSVMLNGTTNRRATMEVKSRWFMLEPGTNTIRFNGDPLGSGAQPTMDITYRSAWLY